MNRAEFEGKQIAMMVAELSKKYDKCILCGRLTKNRGVFLPNEKGLLGADKDKYRVVIYSLCWRHEQNEKTLEEVENFLFTNKDEVTNVTKQLFGETE